MVSAAWIREARKFLAIVLILWIPQLGFPWWDQMILLMGQYLVLP